MATLKEESLIVATTWLSEVCSTATATPPRFELVAYSRVTSRIFDDALGARARSYNWHNGIRGRKPCGPKSLLIGIVPTTLLEEVSMTETLLLTMLPMERRVPAAFAATLAGPSPAPIVVTTVFEAVSITETVLSRGWECRRTGRPGPKFPSPGSNKPWSPVSERLVYPVYSTQRASST